MGHGHEYERNKTDAVYEGSFGHHCQTMRYTNEMERSGAVLYAQVDREHEKPYVKPVQQIIFL